MVFTIVCAECGKPLYSGYDIKPARDILKPLSGKCKKCGLPLSVHDFEIDIENKCS